MCHGTERRDRDNTMECNGDNGMISHSDAIFVNLSVNDGVTTLYYFILLYRQNTCTPDPYSVLTPDHAHRNSVSLDVVAFPLPL